MFASSINGWVPALFPYLWTFIRPYLPEMLTREKQELPPFELKEFLSQSLGHVTHELRDIKANLEAIKENQRFDQLNTELHDINASLEAIKENQGADQLNTELYDINASLEAIKENQGADQRNTNDYNTAQAEDNLRQKINEAMMDIYGRLRTLKEDVLPDMREAH
jgi:predicted nucleotidyltransferase